MAHCTVGVLITVPPVCTRGFAVFHKPTIAAEPRLACHPGSTVPLLVPSTWRGDLLVHVQRLALLLILPPAGGSPRGDQKPISGVIGGDLG